MAEWVLPYAIGVLAWYVMNAPIVVLWVVLASWVAFDCYRVWRSERK